MGSLNLRYPEIRGNTADEQVAYIRSYLYQTIDELNTADWSAQNLLTEINKALQFGENYGDIISGADETIEKPSLIEQYQTIRALLISTADTVIASSEEWQKTLSGKYLAISDFGEYAEETQAQISANSQGITQTYTYAATIDSVYGAFKTLAEAYIKSGLLYYDDSNPVYGVAIGNIYTGTTAYGRTEDTEVNPAKTYYRLYGGQYIAVENPTGNPKTQNWYEKEISRNGNLYSTHTADEIAFWNGESKVASIGASRVWFPRAEIYGGSININDTFKVNNSGKLTATGADISGAITATSGKIANWDINSASISYGSSTWGATGGMYFGTSGLSISNTFKVNNSGKLTATGADISGAITATSGTVGNWDISETALSYIIPSFKAPNGMYFGEDGLSLSNKFYVTPGGILTATNAVINGTITATTGSIGAWEIYNNKIRGTGFYLNSQFEGRSSTETDYARQARLASPAESGNEYSEIAFCVRESRNYTTQQTWNYKFAVFNDGRGIWSDWYIEDQAGVIYRNAGWNSTFAESATLNSPYQTQTRVSAQGNNYAFAVRQTSNATAATPTWTTVFYVTKLGDLKANSIQSATGDSTASDRRMKHDIEEIDEEAITLIDNLTPVSYKLNSEIDGSTHYGFIAQDVEEILKTMGKTKNDFGGLRIYAKTDADGNNIPDEYEYGLAYSEFIAPITHYIKQLNERLRKLEEANG